MTSQFLSMMSSKKFCLVVQIIMYMCSCEISLVTVAFLWQKLSQPQFYEDLTRTTTFLRGGGGSWFKFNDLGLALGANLKFYTSMAKELKLKVKKFWGLIPIEVTGEKLVGWEAFCPPPFLNRVKFTNFLFSSKDFISTNRSCEHFYIICVI